MTAPHRTRTGRPLGAAGCLAASGVAMLLLPSSSLTVVTAPGAGGATGLLIGALMIGAGIVLALAPDQRTVCGTAGILLALASFLTPNLGGMLIGMLLGLVGGALALAWTPI